MNLADIIEISREAIWVMLKIGVPVMLVSLIVGLIVALFQALTQIQEMTLAFIPKIIAVFLSLLIFMPYMVRTMNDFAELIFDKITSL
jgi:flagellar biosynthetic protein FliQ